MVVEDAPQKLTRGDILAEWPPDFDKPGQTQLKLWLRRAVKRGLIQCEGTGRKSDPFRYWRPATEAKWRENTFMYDYFDQQQREHKWPWVSLQERRRNCQDEDRDDSREPADADESAYVERLRSHEQSLEDALTLFEVGRRQFARVLRNLPEVAFTRQGTHNRRGKVTVGDMVQDYVEHVTYHLRFLYDKRTRLGKPLQPSPVVS
jgi:hypothetical protein